MENNKISIRCLLPLAIVIASVFQVFAQNSEIESCIDADTVLIDFEEGFVAGNIVSEIHYPGGTISVFGTNPNLLGQNAAMIFDSGNPTGGDFDLGTPNEAFGGPGMNFEGGSVPSNDVPLGNVLIVSEDLNRLEPDDATAQDIGLSFNFTAPVISIGMDLLDLDSGEAELHLFDSEGNQLYAEMIPETGCNGVAHIMLNVPGVSKMNIWLHGSGAIDNIKFIVACDTEGNNSPMVNDDSYQTAPDQQFQVETPGVLANDTDPDGDTLTIVKFDTTTVQGGTVELQSDGGFTYIPPSGYIGEDSFTYSATDNKGGEGSASVSITITPDGGDEPDGGDDPDSVGIGGNNPPIAENDSLEIDLDNELIITELTEGVLENDNDPDGDSIAVQEIIDGLTDQGGRINVQSDGTLSYIPRLGFVGTDSVEYVVCDDGNPQLCDTAKIYIEVKELPIEVFDAFSPNGDGINDTWVIQGITRFPDNEVQIYNRWGNLIFEASGYDNTTKTWRGTASKGVVLGGDEVPDGAYFYVIDLGDGSKRLSGYVVVRR